MINKDSILPKQLQTPDFRFVLLYDWNLYRKKGSKHWKFQRFRPVTRKELKDLEKEGWFALAKIPKETEWQIKNNYLFNHPKVLQHTGNLGIATGYGSLAILDDDTKDKRLLRLFKENFGETFQIRKDGHLYMILEGLKNKIIFQDPVEKDDKGKPLHLGELQWMGQQCVTVSSIHPIGEVYAVTLETINTPIIKINTDDFLKVFDKYIPKEKEKEILKGEIKQSPINIDKDYQPSELNNLKVTDIISLASFSKVHNGYLGPHPSHGATGPGNFFVQDDGSTWTCHRCNKGKNSHVGCGNAWTLIAVMENIIDCSQSGPRCLSKEQFKEILKIAKEKYGVKLKEENAISYESFNKYLSQDIEPKGWACSVNIERMAKRYNILNCPDCNQPFRFNNKAGMFYCKTCDYGGGLKIFSTLCMKKQLKTENQQ